jgi:hypothetical protein
MGSFVNQPQVSNGEIASADGADRLFQIIHETACSVFGVARHLPSIESKPVNPWFKHCKTEYHALQCAIAQGDTHAARQYRKDFKHVKRRWKRYYSNKLLTGMRDDIRQNPRRFWMYFKAQRGGSLFRIWPHGHGIGKLCMVVGSKVGFTKVQQMLQHLFMS